MKLRWKLSIGLLAVGAGTIILTGVIITPFFMAMNERSDVQDQVFMPFAELRADFLQNGFGVFYLEFNDSSLLTDENVERLLLLNEMPQKYELTLMLDTPRITDESIDTLAKLRTVDRLVVGKSGMTTEGVSKLESLLPAGIVSH